MKYTIWDKVANTWLSPKSYCLNQNGEVIRAIDCKALPNQDEFEVRFISDVNTSGSGFAEIMGYAKIGKVLESMMQDSDVMAFGKMDESKIFNKVEWKKKYRSIGEFLYDNCKKGTFERNFKELMESVDRDIEEWKTEKEKQG